MRYFYNESAGENILELSAANLAHAKARRLKVGDRLFFSALDGWLHEYELIELNRKASARWLNKSEFVSELAFSELALALIDPASINEIAPFLNELGLSRLYVVNCERSQGGFKLDEKRLNKLEIILKNSSEQCGRADYMQIICAKNLDELERISAKKIALIDFDSNDFLKEQDEDLLYLIGPEGGFSQTERTKYKRFKLKSKNILKAKTAVVAVAAKLLV